MDALSNYITALGYDRKMMSFIKNSGLQMYILIGKDILRFHTIYWPIMLMALDNRFQSRYLDMDGFLVDGGKMSKSKGNVVDPVILVNHFGVDAVRYYFT